MVVVVVVVGWAAGVLVVVRSSFPLVLVLPLPLVVVRGVLRGVVRAVVGGVVPGPRRGVVGVGVLVVVGGPRGRGLVILRGLAARVVLGLVVRVARPRPRLRTVPRVARRRGGRALPRQTARSVRAARRTARRTVGPDLLVLVLGVRGRGGGWPGLHVLLVDPVGEEGEDHHAAAAAAATAAAALAGRRR